MITALERHNCSRGTVFLSGCRCENYEFSKEVTQALREGLDLGR